MITIPTKYIGEVKDKFKIDGEFKIGLEDRNETYIKTELKIK